MVPSEQGAARAAPIIHNHIVGKVALFDGLEDGFLSGSSKAQRADNGGGAHLSGIQLQHCAMQNLHTDTGVIHRPLCWSGAGLRLHFLFPHKREGAERRLALRLKSGTS